MNSIERGLLAGIATGLADNMDVYKVLSMADDLANAGIYDYMRGVKIGDEEGAFELGRLIAEGTDLWGSWHTLQDQTPAEDWPTLCAVLNRAGLI